jgi:hypothetical protein
MTQVPGRRTDEFGYLMGMLELAAVDFGYSQRIVYQALRRGFDGPCFAGARWPEEQEAADGPVRAGQAHPVHLVDADNLLNRFLLTGDKAMEL